MFVVIFEVQPKAERWDDYLETARLLRPELSQIDGFLDNERYKSERTSGRVLSLSTWRDEKALVRWRTHAIHHTEGQERGRSEIFADYHLRVGEVMLDTIDGKLTTFAGQRFDVTAVGNARFVTVTEVAPDASPIDLPVISSREVVDQEWFESISTEGKRVLLVAWATERGASIYASARASGVRHRLVRVIRDYGMRDRREAPQYFPEVH
jgi:heme-degrading monooxygenase HmoA